MFTKEGKSNMSLTKAWWMKNFLHLKGDPHSSGPHSNPVRRVSQRIQRKGPFNTMKKGSVE
eukprot:4243114-Prorocentrum_lima.AAC.1